MIDVLAMQQAMPVTFFGPTSRYAGIPTARLEVDGTTIVYVRRRFLPQPDTLAIVAWHRLSQGQRLDHLAAQYFGEPELFWRLADGNRAMRPEALIEVLGRRLAITLPDHVPGMPVLNPPYYLQLMIGPGVPVPVPRPVMDALVSVKVTSNTRAASAFQLTFSLSTKSPLHTLFLVSGGASIPLVRVVIIVVSRGMPDVLMDGVMTHHQVTPGEDGHAVLTVTGEDLSKAMSYLPMDGLPFPAMPPNVRVLAILAKYLVLGVVPVVIPPLIADVAMPTERIDRQNGNDLDYIKCLAEGVGYEFYVDPGPLPLQSTAYWGPSLRIGAPQPALNTNMDAETNVEAIDFSFDAEEATLPIVMIYPKELKVGIPIPVSLVNPLAPPMGLVPPIPKRAEIDRDSARRNPAQALMAAFSKAARSNDAVRATGTLNVSRYGRLLKSRRVVGVRGAGPAFDGLYYVRSVTHTLKRGEFKQQFSLVRNGLVSITPRVPA